MSLMAAASTMLRITNLEMALSLGQHLAQLVQRTYLTWPRPCLERPALRRFFVILFNEFVSEKRRKREKEVAAEERLRENSQGRGCESEIIFE